MLEEEGHGGRHDETGTDPTEANKRWYLKINPYYRTHTAARNSLNLCLDIRFFDERSHADLYCSPSCLIVTQICRNMLSIFRLRLAQHRGSQDLPMEELDTPTKHCANAPCAAQVHFLSLSGVYPHNLARIAFEVPAQRVLPELLPHILQYPTFKSRIQCVFTTLPPHAYHLAKVRYPAQNMEGLAVHISRGPPRHSSQ